MCGREEDGAGVPAPSLADEGEDQGYDELPSDSISEPGVDENGRCKWCGMPRDVADHAMTCGS